MNYFLLDTSTPVCRITIVTADGVRHQHEWQADRTLARNLLGYVRDALAAHELELSAVAGIGVLQGPGSFTGLRIGLTVMNTLADSQSIPIVGAQGDDWQSEVRARLEAGENDQLVMPFYGRAAHITAPRK